jgi:hypothetical protein
MLAHKAVLVGYYWPTMGRDSVEFIGSCDKCQRFARSMKKPSRKVEFGLVTMAVFQMGSGLGRSNAARARKKEVLGGGCGLFHEMGQSRSSGNRDRQQCDKFRLEVGRLLFQNPLCLRHQKWGPV